ncbi:MAG TPA: hypothetical protein PLR25_28960 [Planctomycetaceae bacterium]|nr:hypothetical protein [Planctomycetaceae bacterium]
MKTINMSDHIAATYRALRIGAGVIALAFPLILSGGGHLLANLPLQGSMSAYYHASDALHSGQGLPGQGVMRNEFVGILFAVGVILFLYRGISTLEDQTLNLAGILALGIAIFPMTWPVDPAAKEKFFSLHGACAVSFFFCIAIVCIFCASDTLSLIEKGQRKRYRLMYLTCGVLMVVLPLSAACLKFFAPLRDWTIFFVELAGIYVFAVYWLIKSYEISQTDLDKKAARGQLRVEPRRIMDTLRLQPLTVTLVDENRK